MQTEHYFAGVAHLDAFLLYTARKVDSRDTFLGGRAGVSGDLDLALLLYRRIGRHGF